MSGVNKVTILGRLGKDPEVRNFQNGGKVVNLRVATSERFKDREGNPQERTEWHAVAIFNEKLGDVAQKYLHKGSEVYLEGKLETRKWQDQSGQDRYTTEIVLRPFAGELTLVGGPGQGQAEAASTASREDTPTMRLKEAQPARSRSGGARGRRSGWDASEAVPF
jgi:single-strand DNA-binding protein